MRALLACTILVWSDPLTPPDTVAPAGIPTSLSAEGERGPERWRSLPGSHSTNWAELEQGCQPAGTGERGW